MTFRDVKRFLRGYNVTITRTEFEEYRVNLKDGTEATASYHTDLDDAYGTGIAMAAHRDATQGRTPCASLH